MSGSASLFPRSDAFCAYVCAPPALDRRAAGAGAPKALARAARQARITGLSGAPEGRASPSSVAPFEPQPFPALGRAHSSRPAPSQSAHHPVAGVVVDGVVVRDAYAMLRVHLPMQAVTPFLRHLCAPVCVISISISSYPWPARERPTPHQNQNGVRVQKSRSGYATAAVAAAAVVAHHLPCARAWEPARGTSVIPAKEASMAEARVVVVVAANASWRAANNETFKGLAARVQRVQHGFVRCRPRSGLRVNRSRRGGTGGTLGS